MKSNVEQLEEFMGIRERNRWLEDKYFKIFVRKGSHAINGKIYNTIDVANIVPKKYGLQGKGHFREFMIKAESLGSVYVENIHLPNARLLSILLKNGYTLTCLDELICSAYKLLPDAELLFKL
jgi:hypothetical protein